MNAILLHPNQDESNPYSGDNPAPASALTLDSNLPIPQPLKPGELLIKVEATTMVRDALTWPEVYDEKYKIMGWDFAGTVVAVSKNLADDNDRPSYKPGDEVYGMTGSSRAGTWAQYAIVSENEACLKPKSLAWEQAAVVPMSALTAYQALFKKARLAPPNSEHDASAAQAPHGAEKPEVLVTGAAGNVGLHVVQLARLAGAHVVAATRSNARNEEFLKEIGADEVVEYKDLTQDHQGRFQAIIDSVGGDILEQCWSLIKKDGTIVSVDSASYDFAQDHRKKLDSARKLDKVDAMFFIVEPSGNQLKDMSSFLDSQMIKSFVACVIPLAEARPAYENTADRPTARGKMVLVP